MKEEFMTLRDKRLRDLYTSHILGTIKLAWLREDKILYECERKICAGFL
jgi:hypothetical protein